MAGYDPIFTGLAENDGTGETLYSAALRINSMFEEVFVRLGDSGDTTFVNSLAAGVGVEISDTSGDVTITNTAPYINSFTTVAVIGQQSLLASTTKTLTVIPGNNIDVTLDNVSNRLTIDAATQLQADWNQTDNGAIDFIKNQPIIPTDISDLNDYFMLLTPASRFGEFIFNQKTITTSDTVPGGQLLISPYDANTNVNISSGTSAQVQWIFGGDPESSADRNLLYVDVDGVHIAHQGTVNAVPLTYEWGFKNTGEMQFPNGGSLRVGMPPATSQGASGDVAGSVAFDNTNIYYCTHGFHSAANNAVANIAGGDGVASPITATFTVVPQVGWVIAYAESSAVITQVTPQGPGYEILCDVALTVPSNADFTYGPAILTDIWVKQVWSDSGSW